MELRGHVSRYAANGRPDLVTTPITHGAVAPRNGTVTPMRCAVAQSFPGGGIVDYFERYARGSAEPAARPSCASGRPATGTGGRGNSAATDLHELVRALLDPARGFAEPLARLYGIDVAGGFRQIAALRSLGARAAASEAGAPFRQNVVGLLAATGLQGEVFLALRPGGCDAGRAGMAPDDDEMALCHLLGSSGFAQLCDPLLERPIPLFLQPWIGGEGLLRPQRRFTEPFSRSLAVVRVGPEQMILLDKRFCTSM